MIQNIALLGVGLIGGSLGLAWKKNSPAPHLTGYDRPDVLDEALKRGAIDARAADPAAAVQDADLVVLAAPISANLRILELIGPHLKPGAIVTDVSSVKAPVVEHARAVLPAGIPFIGGHPMAGSEHSGVSHAEALLFENATYVLCPPGGLSESSFTAQYAEVIALFENTGARLLVLEAARHDRIAAAVSHLPQLLAVLLMNFAAEKNTEDEAYLRLAAGGFRDLTRIAASPFNIWRDILIANQGHLLDVMAQFASQFQKMRNRLIEEDLLDLQQAFQTARSSRQNIPKNTKGFLHPLSDVFVYVEDHPGALLGIVQALYEAELNIKDIELLKMREGTGGTFRLGFKDDDVAKAAVSALQGRAYTAFQL